MLHYLATTPGVRERITDDPSLRPLYAEEIIRVFAPIVAVGRTATRDVEVAGTQIRKGDFVMLSQAAAAIDPRFVPDPRTVNLNRKAEVNLAFSYGPHRCIGAHIGRLQMTVALDEILRRLHDIEVADSGVRKQQHGPQHGRAEDPLPAGPAPSADAVVLTADHFPCPAA